MWRYSSGGNVEVHRPRLAPTVVEEMKELFLCLIDGRKCGLHKCGESCGHQQKQTSQEISTFICGSIYLNVRVMSVKVEIPRLTAHSCARGRWMVVESFNTARPFSLFARNSNLHTDLPTQERGRRLDKGLVSEKQTSTSFSRQINNLAASSSVSSSVFSSGRSVHKASRHLSRDQETLEWRNGERGEQLQWSQEYE